MYFPAVTEENCERNTDKRPITVDAGTKYLIWQYVFYHYWPVSVPFSKFVLVEKTFLLASTPKACLPLYFIKSDIVMMFTKVVVTQKRNTENFRNFLRKHMYLILPLQTYNQ